MKLGRNDGEEMGEDLENMEYRWIWWKYIESMKMKVLNKKDSGKEDIGI